MNQKINSIRTCSLRKAELLSKITSFLPLKFEYANQIFQSKSVNNSDTCQWINLPFNIFKLLLAVSFSSNFASLFSVMKDHLYFCNSNIIYFGHKEPIKTQFFIDFGVLRVKFEKFLMSILKRQVNSSSIFALFSIAMAHNFSGDF